jgi:hypothetical protein
MPSTFKEVIAGIPGLTHYYPLTDAYGPNDAGPKGLNGVNHGAVFDDHGAKFDGKSYIQLPDHDDFSAATTGQLTIIVMLTISNWKGAGASEYIHWMGKGRSGAHEYTFRHYVDGGSGEASSRQGRTSFYHFNPAGGLGAGSYFQDSEETVERVIGGMVNRTNIAIWKNGVARDTDALSGYSIVPKNTGTPVCIGSRGDSTGFLVGRIRNVVFFNRQLNATEMKTIYDARDLPVGGVSTPTTPPTTPTEPPKPNPGAAYVATGLDDVVLKHNALVNKLADKGALG